MNYKKVCRTLSMCREQGVVIARDAVLDRDTAIGSGTHIDESARVSFLCSRFSFISGTELSGMYLAGGLLDAKDAKDGKICD